MGAKMLAASVVSVIAYVWLMAYVWSLIPNPLEAWWVFPGALTTGAGGIAVYIFAGLGVEWFYNRRKQ